jgi:hypothetical protein
MKVANIPIERMMQAPPNKSIMALSPMLMVKAGELTGV